MSERQYLCIDQRSFYATVECVARGLDPLEADLVVADAERSENTICLAVSVHLKSRGVKNRCRLKDIPPHIKCIVAVPRMQLYIDCAAAIYGVFLKYLAPEDIYVYSIDESFLDVTPYLKMYGTTAKELAQRIIQDVRETVGTICTCGIGTNLYLAKIALDIIAKKAPDSIGILDEQSYRERLWDHQPITDFWRISHGTEARLKRYGISTMRDIALFDEDCLYRCFGVDAELLIDHAWGWEPCTIADIKSYRPASNSLSSGQVLTRPYKCKEAKLIVREMTELLVLDLVEKHLVTDQIVLTVGYDIENLTDKNISEGYKGDITVDRYGRKIPKHAHGTAHTSRQTSSTKLIMDATLKLYDEIVDKKLLVRRVTIAACNLVPESSIENKQSYEQLDLFKDYDELMAKREQEEKALQKERKIQEAMIDIKERYGKNAILKGTNLQEGATTIERNESIGGHKA